MENILEELSRLQNENTNLRLQASLATELLRKNVDTMHVYFYTDRSSYSYEDWDNFVESCRFLDRVSGKKQYSNIISLVEEYLITLVQ